MDGLFSVQAVMRLVDLVSGPLRNMHSAMDDTGERISSLSDRMGRFAHTMLPVAAGAGMVMLALGSSVATAGQFEKAITQVGAKSNATTAEMLALENAALRLSSSGTTAAFSAAQVAEAEQYLAMAGFKAQENIAALPGVLNLASAANADLARSADIASDILSGFKLPATEMARVADVLAVTVTTANTNLELLGDTMKYVAPVAQKAGMSLEETSAMAGLLANVGIKGSQAGTTLRAMLTRLAAPAGAASSTLRDLGIKAKDLSGNLRSPITILGEMAAKMDGMGSGDQLKHLSTIFGAEAMTGISELMGQEGLGGISKYLTVIQDSAGTAARVAGKQLDNFDGSVTMLSSSWEGLQIIIGKLFLPTLKNLNLGLTEVVGWMSDLARHPVGQWLIQTAGYVSAAIVGVTLFAGAWWGVSTVLPMVKAGLIGVGTSLKALLLPFWPIIAVAGALYLAWSANLGGIQEKLSAFYGRVKLVVGGVSAVFSNLTGSTGEIGAVLAEKLKAAGLLGVVTNISKVIYRIREMFSGMWAGFQEPLGGISEIFLPVMDALGSALSPIGRLIGWIAENLFGLSAATSSGSWRLFGEIIGITLGSAFRLLALTIRAVIWPFEKLFELIGWVGAKFIDLGEWFKGINLFESGAKMINTLVDGIKSRISAPVEAVKGVLNKVRNLLPFSDAKEGPLSQLTLSGAKILDTLGVGMQGAAPGLRKTALAALSGIALAAPIVMPEIATAAPTTIQDTVVTTPTSLGPVPPVRLDGNRDETVDSKGQGKASHTTNSRKTVITIHKIVLPGVTDPESFERRLRMLAEEHDD
ncbi:MAG: phage tail tape measure protein [Magnetococcales bacterium]|nr:phage tail tape measure protein [Magnetococcales bacterium]